METHVMPGWHQAVIFLLSAGVLVPLLHRVRIPPVLGYLIAGGLVGPFGLGLWVTQIPWLGHLVIIDREGINAFAELGVIFLLFMIGLDLSLARLWAMRRWVFGLGSLQVLLTTCAIGGVALAFGNTHAAALVLGGCLALSSTAIVMQLLIERQQMASPLGQASFAILLLQDLAVVPLLFLVGMLGTRPEGGEVGAGLLASLGQGVLVIVLVYLLGRRLVRPVFKMVALSRNVEMFTALTLLTVLAGAALTGAYGLSLALGAFLAGLLLAETEFRHEIEVTIEPFKGLLLGLFFMSVGMGIDFRVVREDLLWILASVGGLFLIKGGIIFVLGLLFRLPRATALESGLLLGQGGEFAFVVVGLAMTGGILTEETGHFMLIVTGLSMMLTPLVASLAHRLVAFWEQPANVAAPDDSNVPDHLQNHVILIGFGRVGRTLGRLLEAERIPFLALDKHASEVANQYQAGLPVFYGDASRLEMLKKLHIDKARALVITMDNPAGAERVVALVRSRWPLLPVFARARDAAHARRLLHLGASEVVPETVEASLHMAGRVLESIGVPEAVARHHVEVERSTQVQGLGKR